MIDVPQNIASSVMMNFNGGKVISFLAMVFLSLIGIILTIIKLTKVALYPIGSAIYSDSHSSLLLDKNISLDGSLTFSPPLHDMKLSKFVSVIDVYLSCDRYLPCCHKSAPIAISAVLSQTIEVNQITVLHSCTQVDTYLFVGALSKTKKNKTGNIIEVSHCQDFQFEICILESVSSKMKKDNYALVLAHNQILEPLAIEQMMLSLLLRQQYVQIVMPLSFTYESVIAAKQEENPLLLNICLPYRSKPKPIQMSPVLLSVNPFKKCKNKVELWRTFIHLIRSKKARVLRVPLFTETFSNDMYNANYSDQQNRGDFQFEVPTIDKFKTRRNSSYPPSNSQPIVNQWSQFRGQMQWPCLYLCVNPFYTAFIYSLYSGKQKQIIPAVLQSDFSFHKQSAQADELQTFSASDKVFFTPALSSLSSPKSSIKVKKTSILFALPSLQVGGSESTILRMAKHFCSSGYQITLVLTTEAWGVDTLGEIHSKNPWYAYALKITADVYDLTALAPLSVRFPIFLHIITTRKPKYLVISNSRWAYFHLPRIKASFPNVVVLDFIHLVDMNEGGGLAGMAVRFTYWIDLHITSSYQVTEFMYLKLMNKSKELRKVKTCPVGSFFTNSPFVDSGRDDGLVQAHLNEGLRRYTRLWLDIPNDALVALFVGRLVRSKGIDVVLEIAEQLNNVYFIVIGPELTQFSFHCKRLNVKLLSFTAERERSLDKYYVASDVLLLPSVNEGISLVVYDTMMLQGAVAIVADVGALREIVMDRKTGFLVANSRNVSKLSSGFVKVLRGLMETGTKNRVQILRRISKQAFLNVRLKYGPKHLLHCVESSLKLRLERKSWISKWPAIQVNNTTVTDLIRERIDSESKRRLIVRPIDLSLTVAVKTYVCDEYTIQQVKELVTSIRARYKYIRIILANDGPIHLYFQTFFAADPNIDELVLPVASGISYGRNALIAATDTKYVLVLDDDHVFDAKHTNLGRVLSSFNSGGGFDIIGLRIQNLPGIEEWETENIIIPRFVANISSLSFKKVTLCVWNENNGPGVSDLMVPLRVDIVHNAFVAKTAVIRKNRWRNELQVNEHLAFFLDLRSKSIAKVGYLPSQIVHHQKRRYSKCYLRVRYREDMFRAYLDFNLILWNGTCSENFPKIVMKHLALEMNRQLLQ